MDLVLLVLAFGIILAGSELFTNGIEWFGHKLELGEGAIGSVLAAVGTAMPETIIPLIAILFGGSLTGTEIGVGAILGGPFMLATLAMLVTGVAVFVRSRSRAGGLVMSIDRAGTRHDLSYFFVAYSIAIGAAFLPDELEWPRRLLAVVLVVLYLFHVRVHLKADAAAHEGLEPLRFHPLDRRAPRHPEPPRLPIVIVQVVFSLLCIIGGAWVFVRAVEDISTSLGINGILLALVIAPLATELPEEFNSALWVARGKDTLALGNITGAMVFQSVFPTSIGLVLAPATWSFAHAGLAFASAAITSASLATIFLPMLLRGRLTAPWLLAGGVFYLVYLAAVLASLGSI